MRRGDYRGLSGRNLRPNWAQGEENYTLRGRIPRDIWVIRKKVKHWIPAVLKQKCARMHQILFQFPFFLGTPTTGGSAPRPPGRGRKGRERERGGEGKGKEGWKEGEGELCVIAPGQCRFICVLVQLINWFSRHYVYDCHFSLCVCPFQRPISRWAWVSRCRSVSILDFIIFIYFILLRVMEVVVTTEYTIPYPAIYRPDALPVAHPTVSEH